MVHWYQWYDSLVPIETDVIPTVLLVNIIKIILLCDLAGRYRAIPMVHWYQCYDW